MSDKKAAMVGALEKSAARRSGGTRRTRGGASGKSLTGAAKRTAKKKPVANAAFAKKTAPKRPGRVVPKALRGDAKVGRAFSELAAVGKLTGMRSEKISARVDPGVMEAAAERLGLRRSDVSDVVNAALALAAAPDRFKTWLRTTEDTLPDDFELAV